VSDIDEFEVTGAGITVYCSQGVNSWGFACSEDGCGVAVGWETVYSVAGGAAGHIRWHVDGKRECVRCTSTLTPDEPGDTCSTECELVF